MTYLYISFLFIALHFIIKIVAYETVQKYLSQTSKLLASGRYTDGCSTPFKTQIHKYLKYSRDLCAAHDYGSLGYINGTQPGYHNNFITWLAHMSMSNPAYWIWGTIVATTTLPWVVFRRNLNQTWMPFLPFHAFLILVSAITTLMIKFPG